MLPRNADARVTDSQHGVPGCLADGDVDAPARLIVVDRIGKQIVDQLIYFLGIGGYLAVARDARRRFSASMRAFSSASDSSTTACRSKVVRLSPLSALCSSSLGRSISCQIRHAQALPMDAVCVPAGGVVQPRTRQQQLGQPLHDRDRRFQLVGCIGEEIALLPCNLFFVGGIGQMTMAATPRRAPRPVGGAQPP